MAKPGYVVDTSFIRKAIENTNEAYARGCKKKAFNFTVNGTFSGNKHGNLVDGTIKVIKQTILAIRDPELKLHSVTLRCFIHDPSTVFNFSDNSAHYEKIIKGVRDFVGSEVSVNHGLIHKKSNDLKLCVEGEMIEKEIWG